MLTAKQENFCLNIAKGMTQSDAYRNAYDADNMTDKQIWEEASKVASNPKVSKRINELREKAESKAIMSAIERKEWLTSVIKEDNLVSDKMKAVDILNKMDGEYVTKVEADVNTDITINVGLSDE